MSAQNRFPVTMLTLDDSLSCCDPTRLWTP